MDEAEVLESLLRAYSPSGQETRAVERFVELARRIGYATEVDAVGNGVARRGAGRPQILFLGHIDTVDGELPVRRRGSRIFGRGACDAKGPLAAALCAGASDRPRGELVVIAAVGEETDSRGARALVDQYRPDFVIAGEPSGWDGISIAYKGDVELSAVFGGERTHLSSPRPSTVERALAWVEAIRSRNRPEGGASAFASRTCKVESIRTRSFGGFEEVEVLVDLRLPPGITTAAVLDALPSEGDPTRVETRVRIEPFESSRADPVVSALSAAIRAEGGRPTLWKKGGTSDINLVAPPWGVKGAAYGPGDPHLDHTNEESVPLADLRASVRVLERAFARLSESAVAVH